MSEKYAVIDIGSNTIVLLVYEIREEEIRKMEYQVAAAHLVQYVKDGHMSLQGIHTAASAVEKYKDWCDSHGISEIHADITACGRGIDNQKQLLDAIASTGISSVRILSGEEEARCSFYGTSLDRTIQDGLMIDIGGGSTELAAFRDNQILDQVSIPLGCVRLSAIPFEEPVCHEALMKMKQEHPLFTSFANGLGVGGTVRACQAMCRLLYEKDDTFAIEDLNQIYDSLRNNDPASLEAMRKAVDPARQEVFVPGLRMLKAVSDVFSIETFHNSENGVREGFLLKYILHRF